MDAANALVRGGGGGRGGAATARRKAAVNRQTSSSTNASRAVGEADAAGGSYGAAQSAFDSLKESPALTVRLVPRRREARMADARFKVDFTAVDVAALKRYKGHYKLRTKHNATKAELAAAIARHFASQPVTELDSITYFVYAVRNQGATGEPGKGTS